MKAKLYFLLALITSFLFSCQIDSRLVLKVDESGEVSGTIKVDRGFCAYYSELLKTLGITDALDGADVFQEEAIRKAMNSYAKVKLLKLKKVSPTTMEGVFTFNSVESIMKDAPKVETVPVVKISKLRTGFNELTFHLSRDNIAQVYGVSPLISQDPTASTFLPSQSNIISEQEYQELVEYMLERKMPNIRHLFAQSYIAMEVVFPRPIKTLKGDASYEGNTMKMKFPLVRLLSLEKPISVTVVY